MCVCAVETGSMKCDICGREEAEWICVMCDNKMVCTDCDLKWHQHPKRLNHAREPLKSQQLTFASITSSLISPGYFVRTKGMSERVESSPATENGSSQKEFGQREHAASVSDVSILSVSSHMNGLLKSEEFFTPQRIDANLLPKCVEEINEDLSYRSLLGVKDSFIPEYNSVEQNSTGRSGLNFMPSTDHESNPRHFSSLTSDFESMLHSLQSKMDEVHSTMTACGQNGSQDMHFSVNDWSLPQAVSKQTSTSNSPTYAEPSNTTVKNVESSGPVTRSVDETQHAFGDDSEVATLLAQTKYPPNMGVSSPTGLSSTEHVKRLDNDKVFAHVKPQNTGRPVDSQSSVFHGGTDDSTLTKGSVQRPLYMHQDGYDWPKNDMRNTLPVENGFDHSVHKDVLSSKHGSFAQSGDQKSQSVIGRQKSQTHVKERLTNLPGVILPRVGDGEDLGVVARPGGQTEPDYHSKFTDIHDEVSLLLFLEVY